MDKPDAAGELLFRDAWAEHRFAIEQDLAGTTPAIAAMLDQALGRGETITALTPRALWNGLKDGSAQAVIMLGILLLILTPIVRVAMTVLLFFKQRDWIFVACAGFVLTILVLGIVGIGI